MKIGIIADVHGDHSALKTALERLDTIHQVDHILCAGDLVGRGPEQEQVVELVRQRGIPTVKGNHDEWAYGVSSAEIADYLEDWFEHGACDGFTIMPPYIPGGLNDFCELVIPELQKRGLFRTEYEGKTLRENLGLPRPPDRAARARMKTAAAE